MLTTKREFIVRMAKKTGTTVSQTEKEVNAFLETLGDVCKETDGICFKGFGTFSKKLRKGRDGEIGGVKYSSEDSNYIHFKTGTLLKDKLNSK